jgi:sarcosine oxidase, subunit gamma
MTALATRFQRRSPLYRVLDEAAQRWTPLADAMVADAPDAAGAAERLAIADLTPLPRLGFKGRGTIPAMQARGIAVEPVPNRAFPQADGGLCLVLAASEVLLLPDLSGDGRALAAWEADWRIEDEERTYPVPRRDSHAWFAVTGHEAPAMFAKICGVDLRQDRFAPLRVAQTQAMRLSVVVVRDDGAPPTWHLLMDSASAEYAWDCLLDAMAEFGGRPAGLAALG